MIKTICGWCGVLMQDGPPSPVSHGMCPACCAKWHAEIDVQEGRVIEARA